MNEQQLHLTAAAIAAHPKHAYSAGVGEEETIKCTGRFCDWEKPFPRESKDSPGYIHARHVADVIAKVVTP